MKLSIVPALDETAVAHVPDFGQIFSFAWARTHCRPFDREGIGALLMASCLFRGSRVGHDVRATAGCLLRGNSVSYG